MKMIDLTIQPVQKFQLGRFTIIKKTALSHSLDPSTCISTALKQANCFITDRTFCLFPTRQCFLHSISSQFSSLNLCRNEYQPILKEISHIKMSKLRVLELYHLGQNGIVNIEPIGWLRAENLRCLNLSGNYITNIKSLAKAYKHSISQLNLGGNLICSFSQLSRMKFTQNQGHRDLYLKSTLKNRQSNLYDLSFLVKLDDSPNIHQEWINITECQLMNHKIKQALRRKSTKQRAVEVSISREQQIMVRRERIGIGMATDMRMEREFHHFQFGGDLFDF